jgi:hypothetical protein
MKLIVFMVGIAVCLWHPDKQSVISTQPIAGDVRMDGALELLFCVLPQSLVLG